MRVEAFENAAQAQNNLRSRRIRDAVRFLDKLSLSSLYNTPCFCFTRARLARAQRQSLANYRLQRLDVS